MNNKGSYIIGGFELLYNAPSGMKCEISGLKKSGIFTFVFNFTGKFDSNDYLEIQWKYDAIDTHSFWYSTAIRSRNLGTNWGGDYYTMANKGSPMGIFFNSKMENLITFAISDPVSITRITSGILEEESKLFCRFIIWPQSSGSENYSVSIMVDTRRIPYFHAIENVENFWEKKGFRPARAPPQCTLPVYSTWYSFHQDLSREELLEEAKLAKLVGFGSIFIDDGWQTSDNARGYGYTGDWIPSREKLGDPKSLVSQLQDYGLKVVFWFAAPFVGRYSKVWSQYSDRILYYNEQEKFAVLDVKDPEVRGYITRKILEIVRDLGLDGVKLDFIDAIHPDTMHGSKKDPNEGNQNPLYTEFLMESIYNSLTGFKENIMIEIRQNFHGPAMRKYGNIVRATDCPQDYLENRKRTADLRLLCGSTPVHSDMIMWNPGDKAETVAKHLINVLFAVPQVSVNLRKLPEEHMEVLKFWINFWKNNSDILMNGKFAPLYPELGFPIISSRKGRSEIVGIYAPIAFEIQFQGLNDLILVNSSDFNSIPVLSDREEGIFSREEYDCRGKLISEVKLEIHQGLNIIRTLTSGLSILHRLN